jgi:hypothetical protein
MPSRKKAQGKARRAKQNPVSISCKHFNPTSASQEGVNDVLHNMLYDFEDAVKRIRFDWQYNAMLMDAYDKYSKLSSTDQVQCREIAL